MNLGDFEKLIKSLNKAPSKTEQTIYMSLDSSNYLDAVIKGGTKAINELGIKFENKRLVNKEREYSWLYNNLSRLDFLAFAEINATYEKHAGWTSDTGLMGSLYNYTWKAKDIQIKYNNYGAFDLMIIFKGGKFSLSIYYCDETGYDQDMHFIEKNIDPKDIFARIAFVGKGDKKITNQ